VPNPRFEEYTTCLKGDTNYKVLKNWFLATKNPIDYLNECSSTRKELDAQQKYSEKSVNIPSNYRGFQYARTGKGYIGMTLFSQEESLNYGDYLSTKLLSPLIVGKTYMVSFYVSRASSSQYGISNISMSFCGGPDCEVQFGYVGSYPSLDMNNRPIIDTLKWTKVSCRFTPHAKYDYLIIGSFVKNISCLKKDLGLNHKTGYAYYYIDDVCIELLSAWERDSLNKIEKKEDLINSKPSLITKGKNIILNNVFFENDKSNLLPTSFPELDALVKYLKSNNSTRIEISGYTDNTGIAEKNITLSKARAKAVAGYLISKGIKENRVNYKGYGGANPVTTNNTESGKARNRRVEFKIVTKQ
jgi:outer membrane protein OmpA-like peptidoglycan-associated protein